ncbi:hypothetical protein ACU80Y_20510 [Pandoraea sputorum]
MKIYGVLISSLLLSAIGSALAEPGSAVTYIDHAPYSGGAAAILPATGGSYVYSTSTRQDSRRPQRFILGKVPRQTFVFFTEQEEDALYRARADRRAAFEDERRKLAIKRSPPRRTAQLNWPKVLVIGDRTCVPVIGYANASNWKEHLTCWNEGASRVE